MLQTFRGIIAQNGKLRILESVQLPKSRQVIITILDDEPTDEPLNLALLSEPALAREWENSEELNMGNSPPRRMKIGRRYS